MTDMPTSAEEVMREPSLSEVLDVPSVTPSSPSKRPRAHSSAASSSASFDTDIIDPPSSQRRRKHRHQSDKPAGTGNNDSSRDTSEPPSLTVALSQAWHSTSWTQRIPILLTTIAINVGLPFINGVMLGFGELFARNVIGVRLGWTTPFPHSQSQNVRADNGRYASTTTTTASRREQGTPSFAAGEKHSASVHTAIEGVEELARA